jgi:putative glutamine amidotransferase
MSRPPIVAVTATVELIRGHPRVRVNESYTAAVLAAGLVPLVVPPVSDAGAIRRIADEIAGLVLTGGEDVDPRRYGEQPHPTVTDVVEARDACELALVSAARSRGIPTLAICRGIQLANVAFGGTLVQDIPSQCPEAIPHDSRDARSARVHEVLVEPRTHLSNALGTERLATNSFHHQSVARAASGFRITARTSDGVVEGMEHVGHDWWMLGVQWHPEELTGTHEAWDRNLFAAFARAVRQRDHATA